MKPLPSLDDPEMIACLNEFNIWLKRQPPFWASRGPNDSYPTYFHGEE